MTQGSHTIEAVVEDALARAMPAVDLLEATVSGADVLRVVVDHPDGVDHEVCVAVTAVLERAGLRDRHAIEVWSPGPEPPLRTPEHFRRALGRRVRVAVDSAGRRARTGTLVSVGGGAVRLAAGDEVVIIPFSEVRRARALEDVGAA